VPANRPARSAKAKSKATATQSSIDVRFALSKLHQVALLATDLDRSIAFYRDVLGLSYMDRYDPPGLAFFHLGGGTRLILSATSSKATLYFKVDDIDSAVNALAARGVFFLHRPSMIHRDDKGRLGRKGVEEWMAFFKDPSDNVLALVAQR
jgi:methylmalonyl-CoA/ethylmalonyl-CoA epimerase